MKIKHIEPIKPKQASGLLREINQQIKQEFGHVAGPWLALSITPEILAGTWAICRESVVCGELSRGQKESIAAAVSQLNTCPFCEEVHGLIASADGERDTIRRLRLNQQPTGDIGQFINWVKKLGPAAQQQAKLSVTRRASAEIMGTYLCYQFINRIVNVFVEKRVLPGPKLLHPLGRKLFEPILKKTIVSVKPGLSLPLLKVPSELDCHTWSASIHELHFAIAALETACHIAGEKHLSMETRQSLTKAINNWDGEPPALGSSWLDSAMQEIKDEQQPRAKFAYIVAIAAWRMDSATLEAARKQCNNDAELLEVAAWAAWISASTITQRAVANLVISD